MTTDGNAKGIEGLYGLIEDNRPEQEAVEESGFGDVSDATKSYGLIESQSDEPAQVNLVPPQNSLNHPPSSATESAELDDNRYLVFRLNQSTYATPILSVREVTEIQLTKPLPHTPDYFVGVANLRGQIVSVIDLRKMFGMVAPSGHHNSLIIVDTASGSVGCIVDYVESVSVIESSDIDSLTRVECKIPEEYFRGFGKVKDDVVIIFDLREAMNNATLVRAS